MQTVNLAELVDEFMEDYRYMVIAEHDRDDQEHVVALFFDEDDAQEFILMKNNDVTSSYSYKIEVID